MCVFSASLCNMGDAFFDFIGLPKRKDDFMKKTLSIILTAIIVFTLSISVFAANGDVVGNIYSTDIRAYINGVEVQSYNIGGKTAVVIEDILKENTQQYIYDDSSRTLKFFSLNPDYLVEGKVQNKTVPGKIIGKIYETDIKTSIYDVTIPTYNIGGKTVVAIEDLGYDGAFSPIGGKYLWNEKERTISLEFLYNNFSNLSSDRNIEITANETMTEAEATFEEVLHCGGMQEIYKFPEYVTDDADIEVIMPIKANGETIGYYFRKTLADNSFKAFTYWYPEKVKEAENDNYKPYPYTTREDTISHFLNYHCVGGPRERFDTDDYSFIYISVAGTSWTSYNLLQVFNDGTYIDYDDEIATRNRSPQNLVVDRENEKVTFKHVDRYTKEWFTYCEIDLKNREIRVYNNLETDIGTGYSNEQPSEYQQTMSRNDQREYKLISGEEEKIVKGFFSHEYYYADMLPLKEAFDFLNIKYSFENSILTIDTSEARAFEYEQTENKIEFLGENPIDYLFVDKVLLNDEETKITYQYTSGHFQQAHYDRKEAKPYVCNGKVYINSSFITWLYDKDRV